MATDRALGAPLEALDHHELDALVAAGAWYAKYHERAVTELVDDASALAVARRERFRNLHAALDKLGVRVRRPEGL